MKKRATSLIRVDVRNADAIEYAVMGSRHPHDLGVQVGLVRLNPDTDEWIAIRDDVEVGCFARCLDAVRAVLNDA